MLCILRRNGALDLDTFHEHWLKNHGGLFQTIPELTDPLWGYEQNHGLRDPDAAFDGVTEQWFESLDSFVESLSAPAHRRGRQPRRRLHARSRPASTSSWPGKPTVLEVVAEGHVDEGPSVGGQLHACGQAALHHGDVAGRQVAVEVGDVAVGRDAPTAGQRARIDAGAGDDGEAQVGQGAAHGRDGIEDPAEEVLADPGAPDGHQAEAFVGAGTRGGGGAPRGRRSSAGSKPVT